MKVIRKIIGTSSLIFSFFLLFSGTIGYLLLSSEPDNTVIIEDVQKAFLSDENSRQERINHSGYDDDVRFATGSEVAEARKHYESTVADYGIGFIYMPSADISEPILAGTDEWNLFNGVGTDRPDQELGEGLFVGLSHNLINQTLLQRIDQMEVDDLVYMTDFKDVYVYRVVRQEIVHESDGKFFEEPAEDELAKLLLYRCEGGYGTEWRRSLLSEFVEKKSFDEVDQSILDGLQIKQVVEHSFEDKDESNLDDDEVPIQEDDSVGWKGRLEKNSLPMGFLRIKNLLADMISHNEFLRDYFLGTYSLVDGNNLFFVIVIIILFGLYGLL